MSSLQQLVDRRRSEAAEGHLCHTIEAHAAALIVVASNGEKWIFPWHQLTHAHLTRIADRDQLALTFSSHLVTVRGRCLCALGNLIASLHLASIRPAPGKYAKSTDPEPFIEVVLVAPHTAPGAGSP